MYKNFSLTESEKEQILNQHREHGYKAPVNEQAGSIGQAVSAITNKKQMAPQGPAFNASTSGMLEVDCKAKLVRSKLPKLTKEANALLVSLYCEPKYRAQMGVTPKPTSKPAPVPGQTPGVKKTVVAEQESNPFKVGQTVKAIRDKDNKEYTIKIAQIGGAYVGGKIMGPGKYQDQPLDGRVVYELTSNKPGQLSGNMDMGVFKITQ